MRNRRQHLDEIDRWHVTVGDGPSSHRERACKLTEERSELVVNNTVARGFEGMSFPNPATGLDGSFQLLKEWQNRPPHSSKLHRRDFVRSSNRL